MQARMLVPILSLLAVGLIAGVTHAADIKALAEGAKIMGAAVEPHAKRATTWGTIRRLLH